MRNRLGFDEIKSIFEHYGRTKQPAQISAEKRKPVKMAQQKLVASSTEIKSKNRKKMRYDAWTKKELNALYDIIRADLGSFNLIIHAAEMNPEINRSGNAIKAKLMKGLGLSATRKTNKLTPYNEFMHKLRTDSNFRKRIEAKIFKKKKRCKRRAWTKKEYEYVINLLSTYNGRYVGLLNKIVSFSKRPENSVRNKLTEMFGITSLLSSSKKNTMTFNEFKKMRDNGEIDVRELIPNFVFPDRIPANELHQQKKQTIQKKEHYTEAVPLAEEKTQTGEERAEEVHTLDLSIAYAGNMHEAIVLCKKLSEEIHSEKFNGNARIVDVIIN